MERELTEALELFGVEARGLRRMSAGRQNEHWRVDTGDGPLVLRRYNALRSGPAIAIEHDALRHVSGLGWPVAPAIARADATTVVAMEGLRYSLFPFLGGKVAAAGNRRMGRIKGRLLARLHHDLGRFPMEGQRDGFGRAWELDLFGPTEEYPTFNALLAGFEREHRDLARAVRSVRYRNLRELSRLGYGDLAVQPCHFDYHQHNLLFDGAELTGLLDFDSLRADARAADLATAIALDCLEAPAHDAIDPRQMGAFVSGYLEGRPLDDEELALVVPLVRAAQLGLVNLRLRQWAAGERERSLASIARSVMGRFPALDARSGLLNEVMRASAEEVLGNRAR